jgi:predicted enzyme related to lactoylglutathione lyase
MKPATDTPNFLGLRTAIYHAPDLAKAKSWYSKILGIEPYFDQPFYVGINVGATNSVSIPIHPSSAGSGGVIVFWGVSDAEGALNRLLSLGATERTSVQDVGEGIRVATVLDPFGNVFGLIENPQFKLPSA